MENMQRSLQDVGKETLLEFVHSCVDDICEKKRQHNYDNFKSCTNWSQEEYDMLHATFKKLIFSVLGNLTPEKNVVEQCPFLSSDHVQCILDCLAVRKADIENLLLRKAFTVSGPKLQDFDWKLKWVIGSSALSSLREPLLVIDFNLCKEELGNKSISLELNRSELKMLLASLEKAQETVKN